MRLICIPILVVFVSFDGNNFSPNGILQSHKGIPNRDRNVKHASGGKIGPYFYCFFVDATGGWGWGVGWDVNVRLHLQTMLMLWAGVGWGGVITFMQTESRKSGTDI